LACTGGEQVTIPDPPIPPNDEFPRWSPDGTHILYFHQGLVAIRNSEPIIDPQATGLWVVGSDGSSPRQLLRETFVYGDWNASSDTLVYAHSGRIFRAAITDSTLDSLSVLELTGGGGFLGDFFPAWSPDSRWIAYDSDSGDDFFEIWVMRPDGSEKRMIDHTGGDWRMPSWSPTLSICHIRYPTDTNGTSEVFTMTDTGADALRITKNDRQEGWPKYSPDGSRIVFESFSVGDISVWIANSDGTGASRLLSGRHPCWAPDGQWIAFVRFDSDPLQNGTIWKVRTNGTGLTQVTYGPQ
jgi:TolB protein